MERMMCTKYPKVSIRPMEDAWTYGTGLQLHSSTELLLTLCKSNQTLFVDHFLD